MFLKLKFVNEMQLSYDWMEMSLGEKKSSICLLMSHTVLCLMVKDVPLTAANG